MTAEGSAKLPRHGDGLVAEGKPAILVLRLALHDGKEAFLQAQGNRTGLAFAHYNAVHGADGCDLRSRAGEKDFVGDIKQFARDDLLADRVTKLISERDDGIARDAGKDGRGERRGDDLVVAH